MKQGMYLNWLGSIFTGVVLCVTSVSAVAAQTCPSGLESQLEERLEDQEDGTIFDTETGLLWWRCSWGSEWETAQCQDEPLKVGWEDALVLADELAVAGYTDWRLPNINELQSIVEWGCYDPAINASAFPDVEKGRYWSSSARKVGDEGVVLMVDFFNGRVRDQSLDSGYVLFVRQMQ
ncbi:MAG: hypothetical protein CMI09_05640 [Oceanospirillaceae bacterium]|nr:hypothetical protein [Oceanospirillaceae bacterium]|tara:strand:+ start:405 stop:938 length:534 start_codon:yes stop_codon:yes gene_type:complete